VATDQDRFCSRLGRRFLPVRALLCGPERDLGVDAAGQYLERRTAADDDDFASLVRAAQRLLARPQRLLGDYDPELDRFARNESRSLPAFHLIGALREVIRVGGDQRELLPRYAERAVDGTVACAQLQRDYKDDKDLHRELALCDAQIKSALSRRLISRYDAQHIEPAPADKRHGDQTQLLDLVITVPDLERAR